MEEKGRSFVKVIGLKTDYLETEILEEVNRGTIDEGMEFIKEHPHDETTWILLPMHCHTNL